MKILIIFLLVSSLQVFSQNQNAKKLVECNEAKTDLTNDCYCNAMTKDIVHHNGQKHCLSKCANGTERRGLQCIQSCRADERRNEQGICIRCSGSMEWVGDKCLNACTGNQRREGEQCITSCLSGYEQVGDVCLPNCPKNSERVGNSCLPFCPPGTRREGGESICKKFIECKENQEVVGNKCLKKCHPKKQKRDPATGVCINQIPCNPGYVEFKGKCRAECPPGQERIEIEGQSNDQCVNKCPVNYTRNTNGACVYCEQ